jgi:hypothetical protein
MPDPRSLRMSVFLLPIALGKGIARVRCLSQPKICVRGGAGWGVLDNVWGVLGMKTAAENVYLYGQGVWGR